jgi:hypothetical protein
MNTTASTIDRKIAVAIVATLVAIAPAACKQAEAVEPEHYQAAKVTPAKDGSGHPTVTLTKLGAEQIQLETVPVSKSGSGLSVPYAAILYDGHDGQSYVYVNAKGLDFHREDVTIESIDDDTVELSAGPTPGTPVVIRGLPQVHGAELEYGAY